MATAVFAGKTYNLITGTTARDRLLGRLGDDWIQGGAGDDTIIDLLGTNLFDGGRGSDTITGGVGSDTFIHRMSENVGEADRYDGGIGQDTLRLEFTLSEWANSAVQTDIAAFLAHTSSLVNRGLGLVGMTSEFTFKSMNLKVTNIEKLRVFVEGVEFSAQDDAVIARGETLAVTSANAASVNVLQNDVVADRIASITLNGAPSGNQTIHTPYGTITLTPSLAGLTQTATLTFTPGSGYTALKAGQVFEQQVSYTIRDVDGDTGTATTLIRIVGVNDLPTAPETQNLEIDEDTASGAIAIGAADVDGDTLSYASKVNAGPSKGTVSFDQTNGSFTYTPNANANGTDSFTIVVDDGKGGTTNQTVSVNVNAVSDAPVLTVNPATGDQDTAIPLVITAALANPSETLSFTITGIPDGSSLSNAANEALSIANGSVTLTSSQLTGLTIKPPLNSDQDFTLTVSATSTDGSAVPAVTTTSLSVTVEAPLARLDLKALSPTQGFVIQGHAAGDRVGYSVSTAGDVNGDGYADLIVGAPLGFGSGFNAGEAYVVFGSASAIGTADAAGRRILDLSTLTPTQGFIIQGDAVGDQAGYSVSTAGDVNGDGFADLIVGAPFGDDGGRDAGEAYVVFGSASGVGTFVAGSRVLDLTSLTPTQGFVIRGDVNGDFAGYSVSTAGDINSDGYADLIVGAPLGFDGGFNAGEAYVVFGSASAIGTADAAGRRILDLSTLTSTQGFIIQGDAVGDQAGYSVSAAGDINGDGFADAIVGALGGDDGGVGAGEAYVVFGSASGIGTADAAGRRILDLSTLTPTQGFVIRGDYEADSAGFSVSTAGDVNGDGFADVVVGAPNGDDGGVGAGEAYVVFGSASGAGIVDTTSRRVLDLTNLAPTQGFIIQGDAGDQAGRSVSTAGDVNGDGFADLIVGAPFGGDGGIGAYEAYVVFGAASGVGTVDTTNRQVLDLTNLSPTQGFVVQGDNSIDRTGWSVSSAGDVNGDGFADLIVGAPFGDDGGTDAGEAYVLYGSAFGRANTPVVTSGTTAAEILIGALGDDVLSGGGGADVIRAGAGNDRITVATSTFRVIDGGGGSDTLVLPSGLSLDFRTLPEGRIQSIEAIDLTNGSAQTITLDILDVFNFSDAPHAQFTSAASTLIIDGDVGDTVRLSEAQAGAWNFAGTIAGSAIGGASASYELVNYILPGGAITASVAIDADMTRVLI